MRGLAYRRHQLEKKKERFRQIVKIFNFLDESWSEAWALRMAACHKPCSCAGCGNPRRHFGELTRQELRANLEEDA